MTDPNNTSQDNSYVDNYQPPVTPAVVGPSPSVKTPTPDPVIDQQPAEDKPVTDQEPLIAEPPAPMPEGLAEQNIFFLLGVENSKDEEKESFLDELQQVIWEDFLENDVRLLITQEEYLEFEKIIDKPDQKDEEKQEELLVYLEKLIPDLEEIMMEKAIELKAEMFKERIMGLKEFYVDNSEAVAQVNKAEEEMKDEKWFTSAEILNKIK